MKKSIFILVLMAIFANIQTIYANSVHNSKSSTINENEIENDYDDEDEDDYENDE